MDTKLIEDRISELRVELDVFVSQANTQIAVYHAILSELETLLAKMRG